MFGRTYRKNSSITVATNLLEITLCGCIGAPQDNPPVIRPRSESTIDFALLIRKNLNAAKPPEQSKGLLIGVIRTVTLYMVLKKSEHSSNGCKDKNSKNL